MEWGDALRSLAAFGGLGLGLWNLLAPRWMGVIVRKAPAGVTIINTGARPIYIQAIGWAKGPAWAPHHADIERRSPPAPEDELTVEPWRSRRFSIDVKADLRAAWPDEGFEPEEGESGQPVWFVRLESDALFTNLPWYRLVARLNLGRKIRRTPEVEWSEY